MGMLRESLKGARVSDFLVKHDEFVPFPKGEDRAYWDGIDQELKQHLIQKGEEYLGYGWPVLLATDILAFTRPQGDRVEHEKISFGRRMALGCLVVAECAEGKGRFIDDIINGIWAICEESSWCSCAHLHMSKRPGVLPDVENDVIIDLFAAESGQFMAFVSYLLGDSLDKVSPLINRRILFELDRRIFTPYLERRDYWWMGYTDMLVNNWDPWCNSNCIWAFLLACSDEEKRGAALEKAIESLDLFIDIYHADGACDEGPRYWNRAAAALMDALEAIHTATNGAVSIFDQPLIGEMGRFIVRARIDQNYYINFSDSSAICHQEPAVIYRYGKAIGDQNMMAEGAYLQSLRSQPIQYATWYAMNRVMNNILVFEELKAVKEAPTCEQDVWFDGVQVMIAREKPVFGSGLFVAAKGGHNDESHNHNDVGSFLVYEDGKPLIIDAGVGVYTAKTFGPNRYSLWTMGSGGHNLPVIGGYQQLPGKQYAAKEACCSISEECSSLELELRDAYPLEAQILSWRRRVCLDRVDSSVGVSESFCLKEPQSVGWVFLTCHKPQIEQDGVRLGSRKLTCNGLEFRIAVQFISTADDNELKKNWGEGVYKLTFDGVSDAVAGNVEFILK